MFNEISTFVFQRPMFGGSFEGSSEAPPRIFENIDIRELLWSRAKCSLQEPSRKITRYESSARFMQQLSDAKQWEFPTFRDQARRGCLIETTAVAAVAKADLASPRSCSGMINGRIHYDSSLFVVPNERCRVTMNRFAGRSSARARSEYSSARSRLKR